MPGVLAQKTVKGRRKNARKFVSRPLQREGKEKRSPLRAIMMLEDRSGTLLRGNVIMSDESTGRQIAGTSFMKGGNSCRITDFAVELDIR